MSTIRYAIIGLGGIAESCLAREGFGCGRKRLSPVPGSFCQSKHFTTAGEGGAVITDDEDLAWRCRSFRDHGYDVQKRLNLLELESKLMHIHTRVGFNYRMTEVQSAIGLAEPERFASWNLPARRVDYSAVRCPTAHWLSDRTISFFTHPVYTERHVELMIAAFEKVAAAYAGSFLLSGQRSGRRVKVAMRKEAAAKSIDGLRREDGYFRHR